MCALALIAVALFGVARCTRAGTSSVPQVAPPAALASGPTLRTIAQENALPGSAGWAITRPALDGQIAAYTGEASAQRGETLDVYVSTKGAASYRADIYRMGWYGGAGPASYRHSVTWTAMTRVAGIHCAASPVVAPAPSTLRHCSSMRTGAKASASASRRIG
jgi:hypothetical protein